MLEFVRPWLAGLVVATAILLVMEGSLRLAGIGDPAQRGDPFTGFSGQVRLFERVVDGDGGEWFRTAESLAGFNRQRFPATKPPGTTRIFCLGGSTTYGRPFEHGTSFCGWLEQMLKRAAPSRNWEVANAGGISYASYRIAVLMEELLAYEPDLFILYSGHNEYLEKRTYRWIADLPRGVVDLAAWSARSHLFGALQSLVDRVAPRGVPNNTDQTELQPDVNELLNSSAGFDLYNRNSLQRARAVRHYRYNLTRINELAENAGARVLWIMPAANLKDMSPFKSEAGERLSPRARNEIARIMAQIKAHEGDPETLLQLAERAVGLDPAFADIPIARQRIDDADLNVVMSNSFGFGGTNGTLVLQRYAA